MTIARCARCGAPDTRDARYCWHCGNQLPARAGSPAGLILRATAWTVDVVVCLMALGIAEAISAAVTYQPPSILRGGASSADGFAAGVIAIVWGVCAFAYFCIPTRQTLGAMTMGIELLDARTGASIGRLRVFGRVLARVALYAALLVPGILCDLFTIWTRRKQNLIDLVFKTVVVRT